MGRIGVRTAILLSFVALSATLFVSIALSAPINTSTQPIWKEILSVPVGSGDNEIKYNLYAPGGGTEGPGSFAVGNDGTIYILDSLGYAVKAYHNGVLAFKVPIPTLIEPYDIAVDATGQIYVHDHSRLYIFGRDGSVLAQTDYPREIGPGATFTTNKSGKIFLKAYDNATEIDASELTKGKRINVAGMNGGSSFDKVHLRATPDKRGVEVWADNRLAARVSPSAANTSTVTGFLGSDSSQAVYLEVLEMINAPQAAGEQTVRKYSGGQQVGIAAIPLDKMAMVPNKYIRVTAQGQVYMLYPQQQTVKVFEVQLGRVFNSRIEEIKEKLRQKWGTEWEGGATVTSAQKRRVMASAKSFGRELAYNSVSRSEAQIRAVQMINYQWYYGYANYTPVPSGATRPDWLTTAGYNKTLQGIPYAWGGFDSLETSSNLSSWSNYGDAMSKGKFAGNINTSSCCWVAGTAGLDCAGFVGVAWKLTDTKRNTEGLAALTTQINQNQIQYMDAAYWPYRHILVFGESYDPSKTSIITYESTTDGDDKVKVWTRSWAYLTSPDRAYQWRKYNYIY